MTNASWIRTLSGLAILGLSTGIALAQSNNFNSDQLGSNSVTHQALTGVVTSTAQLNHRAACRKNETLYSCTLRNVDHGAKFVLMVGDKPYLLQGDSKDIERFAGGKATVMGPVDGDNIQVEAVSSPGTMPQIFRTPEPAAMTTSAR